MAQTRGIPVLILLLSAVALLTAAPSHAHHPVDEPPAARAGVLDARDWGFDHHDPLDLVGAWRIWPDALIPPEEIGDAGPGNMILLPADSLAPAAPVRIGGATFALDVLLPPGSERIAIMTPDVHGALKLWANGQLIAEMGTPGLTAETERATPGVRIARLPAGNRVTLVAHYSNHVHYDGGLNRPFVIGTVEQVIRLHHITMGIGFLMSGGLLILALYHLVVWIVRPGEATILIFAGLSTVLALTQLTHANLHVELLGDIDQAIGLKVEFALISLSILFAIRFVVRLFPEEAKPWIHQPASVVLILMLAFIVATPSLIATQTRPLLYVMIVVLFAILFWTLGTSLMHRRIGSGYLLAGAAFAMPLVVNDILHASRVVDTAFMASAGLLVFALALAAALGARLNAAFVAVESLSQRLARANDVLEAEVAARTTELARTNEALSEANDAKNRFLSIIAHDLRSPLHALHGFARMIAEEGNDLPREQLLEYNGFIHESASNLNRLLEGLLQWSRLQMDRLTPQPVEIDMGDIVQNCIKLLQPQAQEKQIRLVSTVGALPAQADKTMTETALRNLIANAIKFTRDGGLIAIGGIALDDCVEVTVTDTGVGMDDKTVEGLFRIDNRSSLPGTRGERGSGMGLLLTKEIIDRQGGDIWVESRPGEGSTFHITLPLPGRSGPPADPPEPEATRLTAPEAAE